MDYFYDGDSSESTAAIRRRKNFENLNGEDIERLQQNHISTISAALSISRGEACTLLYRNNWSLVSVYDQWLAFHSGEPTIHQPIAKSTKFEENQTCKICFDDFRSEIMVSAACDHQFCIDCWRIYVATAIDDGSGCLNLTCPEPGCEAAVDLELVESLASSHHKARYSEFLCRSFVECSRERKWCPFPNCEFAVEFAGIGNSDVTCACNHKFCWNCKADHHSPVDCETASRRRKIDSESIYWIHFNTMPCPKCKRPIQKDGGCDNMKCIAPCFDNFTWNAPPENSNTKMIEVATEEDNMIGADRYARYIDSWNSNDNSRALDEVSMRLWREERVEKLSEVQGLCGNEMWFVKQAWEQVLEMRRVLDWGYAYGCYMEVEEPERSEFFGFLQGEAEGLLKRLHDCVDREMNEYLECRRDDFGVFKGKVIGLTAITKNYFQNFQERLEYDLCEVEIQSQKKVLLSQQVLAQEASKEEVLGVVSDAQSGDNGTRQEFEENDYLGAEMETRIFREHQFDDQNTSNKNGDPSYKNSDLGSTSDHVQENNYLDAETETRLFWEHQFDDQITSNKNSDPSYKNSDLGSTSDHVQEYFPKNEVFGVVLGAKSGDNGTRQEVEENDHMDVETATQRRRNCRGRSRKNRSQH